VKFLKNIGVWLAIAAAVLVGFLKLRGKGPSKEELDASTKILERLNVRDARAVRAEAERRRQAARTINPTEQPSTRGTLDELLAKVRARREADDPADSE
jgi:hypothetical protein